MSNRFGLDDDKGMLFLTKGAPYDMMMWMKDTYISLDMVFFDDAGKIVYIWTARPLDLTPVSAGQLVRGVLELKGGTAKKLNIKVGDKVIGY